MIFCCYDFVLFDPVTEVNPCSGIHFSIISTVFDSYFAVHIKMNLDAFYVSVILAFVRFFE